MGGEADIIFKDSVTLMIGDYPVQMFTLPAEKGHTSGDVISYFIEENTLYVGDYYFASGFPIIDAQSGDLQGYLANMNFLVSHFTADTVVIPGHTTFSPQPMETITIKQLERYRRDLQDTVQWIQALKVQGQSLEQIQHSGLPARFSHYNAGDGFVDGSQWIAYVYGQLH